MTNEPSRGNPEDLYRTQNSKSPRLEDRLIPTDFDSGAGDYCGRASMRASRPYHATVLHVSDSDIPESRYTAEKVSSEEITHYVVTALRKSKRLTTQLQGPRQVYRLVHKEYDGELREVFRALYLNTKNYVLSVEIISIGSLNACVVHPREILKPAITQSAASLILVHNHPSGDPTPSREDTEFTKRMAKSGELIGIELLDHIIIGDGSFISLKERGDF